MTQTTAEPRAGAEDGVALGGLSAALVEQLSRQRDEPDWLRRARLEAWKRYEALPKPSTRDEGWRRTDLSALDLDRLAVPEHGASSELAPPAVDGARAIGKRRSARDAETGERAGLLKLRNGKVQAQLLDARLAARGVQLTSLAEAVAERPGVVQEYLRAGRVQPNENKLAALSAALWDEGAFLFVPRGLAVESPFEIVHETDLSGPTFARTLIVAEAGSTAALVQTYASPDGRPESLASSLVDVIVKEAAQLSCVQLQERDEQTWSFASLHSEQERDSALTWLLLGLGSRLSRTELAADLNGQGAETDLIGMVFGHGRQQFDYQTLQNHLGSDSRSDLLLKVALHDRASSTFTGLIRVGKSALRTSSNQENRNLLLSGEARADSDPKLEILNSDVVRCGHGATVGPVDEEQIFYLMTRGLSHDEAERLIVEGFFGSLLARVPVESVRQHLWDSIQRKLASA